jgi:hypothetical protein
MQGYNPNISQVGYTLIINPKPLCGQTSPPWGFLYTASRFIAVKKKLLQKKYSNHQGG